MTNQTALELFQSWETSPAKANLVKWTRWRQDALKKQQRKSKPYLLVGSKRSKLENHEKATPRIQQISSKIISIWFRGLSPAERHAFGSFPSALQVPLTCFCFPGRLRLQRCRGSESDDSSRSDIPDPAGIWASFEVGRWKRRSRRSSTAQLQSTLCRLNPPNMSWCLAGGRQRERVAVASTSLSD